MIEEKLFPNINKLYEDGETLTASIVDEELDLIECTYNYDNCVKINTEELTYITLNRKNLNTLRNLLSKADKYYREQESL